jgi:hypothetical protein
MGGKEVGQGRVCAVVGRIGSLGKEGCSGLGWYPTRTTHVLLGGARDGVVVLVDAEGTLEAVEGVGRGHVRGAAGEGLELLRRLEIGGRVPNVPLEALARDKVARPVRVRAVSVGEEVVGLEG